MATLTIDIPDDVFTELSNIADQLKITAEECVQLSLNHLLQTHTLDSALEGSARIDDGEELVDFPELKEELGLDIKFHPMAMEELEALTEEEQVSILEELISRITSEDVELEDTLDLVLKDQDEKQTILSEFDFGDVVYQIGSTIVIYHIAILNEIEEEDGEDEEEDEEIGKLGLN